MNARYREIQHLATAHPVAVLCPLLGVSRSGFYDWRGHAPSRRQSEDARLTVELKSAFAQSRRTSGRPRLRHALAARGHRHGERRIGRLMRLAGLRARARRRFVPQCVTRKRPPLNAERILHGRRSGKPRRADTMAPSPPTAWPNAPRRRPAPMKSGPWT